MGLLGARGGARVRHTRAPLLSSPPRPPPASLASCPTHLLSLRSPCAGHSPCPWPNASSRSRCRAATPCRVMIAVIVIIIIIIIIIIICYY